MAAGLTVYNNDNIIQIDGAFKNLQLSRKIALSGAGETSGTFADGEVIAAVGGTTSQNIDAYCANSKNGWKCKVKTFTSGMCVYVFTTKATASTHGVGLEVYDENGVIVYNSNERHPVVMGFGNSDSTAAGRAVKPAIAVCQHRRLNYNRNMIRINHEWIRETENVWHDPVYGWVEHQELQLVYHDAVYEWVAGHYEQRYVAGHYESQWVSGSYEYNWSTGQYEWTSGGFQNVWIPGGYESVWVDGEYRLVTPAYSSSEYVTVRKYEVIEPGGYETVINDVLYYREYETIYYLYTDTNFRLSSGNVTSGTVEEGQTGHSAEKMVLSQQFHGTEGQNNSYWGKRFKYTEIVVDTRSWILFDVNGL